MQYFKGWMLTLVLALCLTASPVFADVEFSELGKAMDKVTLGMDLSTFYRVDSNPYYGAPIGTTDRTSAAWGELFATIRLTAEKDFGWAKASGQFAPFYTQTVDQDAYGVAKDQGDLQVDQAWIKFGQIQGGPFSLTLGRQDLRLENWLVVADGDGQSQGIWLNFHDSFPFVARLDGDFGNLKTTLYWARSDNYVQKLDETALFGPVKGVEIAGLTAHYDFSDTASVFAGVHQKMDEEARLTDDNLYLGPGLEARNNTTAWDLGAHLGVGGLVVEGEGVIQSGSAGSLAGVERDRKAFGGFGSVAYNFENKYAPYVRGSYFYFSGDDDPADDEAADYDPMFGGFVGWNRFIIGEITGELHLPNSNKKSALLEVGFSPLENVFVSLHYLKHKLAENYYLFIPTTSDDWADEVNLFVDVPVNDNLFVHVGTGVAKPGDAAKEIFGSDDNDVFGQVWIKYSF